MIYNQDISFMNLERRPSKLVEEYGLPSENLDFWQQIDAYSFLSDIGGAVQLHHGTADDSVPVELSAELEAALKIAGREVELYQYQGADHNLSGAAFGPAMERTVQFFKKQLRAE